MSEIRVDTISEKTSANGVAVDGVTIKDGNVGAAGTATSVAGIPFFQGDTGSIYTHDVSGTDSTAQYNTAFGLTALDAITTGDSNTTVGYGAGGALTTGTGNVIIGKDAGDALTDDSQSTLVGAFAGTAATVGQLTGVGYGALNAVTTGVRNTAIGYDAGNNFDAENDNLFIGYAAGAAPINGGEYNVAVGNYSLDALTSGDYNTVLGYNAGSAITTGNSNTFIGYEAGKSGTSVLGCTFVGEQAGRANTEDSNTGIGRDALYTNTTGRFNVAVGDGALTTMNDTGSTDEGDYNVAVGYQACSNLTTGFKTTAIGYQAGNRGSTTKGSVYIGYQTYGSQTSNGGNNLVGNSSGQAMTTAYYNNSLGASALPAVTEGYNNIAIGHDSGSTITTGNHNIHIGYKSKANDATDVYSILIGHGDGINAFTSGGGNTVRIGRRVGYITNDFSANATWSHSSDERYKKDITNNTDCGLDFINELRPITYKWKAQSELDTDLPEYDKDETSAIHTAKNYGLIAQEVKAALDKLNITDFGGWKIDSTHEKDRQEISEQMFVYPLIKAVQELSAQVTTLQNEVNTLKGE